MGMGVAWAWGSHGGSHGGRMGVVCVALLEGCVASIRHAATCSNRQQTVAQSSSRAPASWHMCSTPSHSRRVQVRIVAHVLLHALAQLGPRRRVPVQQALHLSCAGAGVAAGLRRGGVKVPGYHAQTTRSVGRHRIGAVPVRRGLLLPSRALAKPRWTKRSLGSARRGGGSAVDVLEMRRIDTEVAVALRALFVSAAAAAAAATVPPQRRFRVTTERILFPRERE